MFFLDFGHGGYFREAEEEGVTKDRIFLRKMQIILNLQFQVEIVS